MSTEEASGSFQIREGWLIPHPKSRPLNVGLECLCMKGGDRRCYNLSKPLNYDPGTQPSVLGTAEFSSKLLWFRGKPQTLGGGVICPEGSESDLPENGTLLN